MDNVITYVGTIVVGFGGLVATIGLAGFMCWLACLIWIAASNRFRSICKAESLIFEYRKYREEFMAWKAVKDGAENG